MNFPLNNTLTRGTGTDDPSIKALSDFNKNGLIANQPRFYSKYDKIRMIYDLDGQNVSMSAMLKLKKVFEEIGVEHLDETCIICKDGIKKTLIKKFLKLVKTERPVRFL